MNKLLMGVAITSLVAIAPAFGQSMTLEEKRREQLLYQESQRMEQPAAQDSQDKMVGEDGAIGETKPTSGPGVQGPPGTRTGPAAKAPSDPSDSSASGASSGEAGTENTTEPSQDSSGVQGFPDTRTGPSTKAPSEDGSMEKNSQ